MWNSLEFSSPFFSFSSPPPLSKSRLRFISRVFYSNRASSLSPYSHVRNPSSSLPDVSTIYHSRFRNIYIREGKVTERNERQMRSARPWRVSWNGQIALVLFRRETDPRLLVSSEMREISRCIRNEKFFWEVGIQEFREEENGKVDRSILRIGTMVAHAAHRFEHFHLDPILLLRISCT